METSREDFGIAIRSAFLSKGTKQRFSLFVLVIVSSILIFLETLESKPLNSTRAFFKDIIYRGAIVASYPLESISGFYGFIENHLKLYKNYTELVKENDQLKNDISKTDSHNIC